MTTRETTRVALAVTAADNLGFLAKVRAITGISLGELRSKFSNGEPFWTVPLYLNDHEEQALILGRV